MTDGAPGRLTIPWPQVGAVIGVLVFLGTLVTFLTGGIHPQWQADIADLKAANAALQADLKAAVVAGASERSALAARIDTDKQLVTTRLDGMWRTNDYTDRDNHLARLDTVFDGLRERVTQLEYAQKDLLKSITPRR